MFSKKFGHFLIAWGPIKKFSLVWIFFTIQFTKLNTLDTRFYSTFPYMYIVIIVSI